MNLDTARQIKIFYLIASQIAQKVSCRFPETRNAKIVNVALKFVIQNLKIN